MSYESRKKIQDTVCQSVSCPFSKIQRFNIFLLLSPFATACMSEIILMWNLSQVEKLRDLLSAFTLNVQKRKILNFRGKHQQRSCWGVHGTSGQLQNAALWLVKMQHRPSVSQPASHMARLRISASSIIHSSKLCLSCKSPKLWD